MEVRDYYETLQVTPEAEPEVIEAAYKRLAFKYHPDRNPGSADAKMRDLNEAYETLRDPQRRQHYDQQRNAEQTLQQLGQYVHGLLDQGQSPDDVIKNLVQMGIDLETSARLVGTVVDIRRTSAPSAGAPGSSSSPLSSWWSSNWGWVVLPVVIIGGLYLYNGGGGKNDFGKRLAFGKGEVYFTNGVQQAEAQKLGEELVREGYFADRPATVQVRYENRRYEVRCVVRAGAENDTPVRAWEKLSNTLSKECFRGSPVDIHLCDEHLKTLRVVAFKPLKPDLPIAVTFRPSIGGGSLVAQYRNNSTKYLTVRVTLRNATVNQTQQVTLNIGPNQTTEHGWAEGWSYRSGELIDIAHADYETLELRVP